MRLIYIKAGDEENNLDLFVWAETIADAKREWRSYYEMEDSEEPDRMWEITSAAPKHFTPKAEALGWGNGVDEL